MARGEAVVIMLQGLATPDLRGRKRDHVAEHGFQRSSGRWALRCSSLCAFAGLLLYYIHCEARDRRARVDVRRRVAKLSYVVGIGGSAIRAACEDAQCWPGQLVFVWHWFNRAPCLFCIYKDTILQS